MNKPNRSELIAIVIGAITLVAIIVLIIDMGIKNDILDQAKELQRLIEAATWKGFNDPRPETADSERTRSDTPIYHSVPSDLVDRGNAGMEAPESFGEDVSSRTNGSRSSRNRIPGDPA